VSRCPVSRCPAGHAPSGVRGAAAGLSAGWPLEWLGVAGRPRLGAAGRRAPGGLWAAWLPACIRPDGKGMARRLAVPARRRVDRSQGRRVAGVPAAAPPWPRRADMGAGPGQGAGRVAGEHGTEQVLTGPAGVLGRSSAWCLTMGLDQEAVTTLGGRWARVVRWRPAPEGPLGSVGEQPAAAARPRRLRSVVR